MKKKRTLIIILLLVLLVPFTGGVYGDGGTFSMTSLTYKVIRWHRMDDNYEGGFKTGFEIHFSLTISRV